MECPNCKANIGGIVNITIKDKGNWESISEEIANFLSGKFDIGFSDLKIVKNEEEK